MRQRTKHMLAALASEPPRPEAPDRAPTKLKPRGCTIESGRAKFYFNGIEMDFVSATLTEAR